MSESPSPDEIRAEIEQTRSDLGDTVDALTTKLDVKAQAKQKVDSVRSTISGKAAQAKGAAPTPVQKALDRTGEAATPALQKAAPYKKQIALGAAGLLGVLLFWRRRRSS
jgi:hypothetical protein